MKNLFYLFFISSFLFFSCDEAISIEEIISPPEEVIPDPTPDDDETESNGKEPITDMPYSQIPDKDYIIDLAHWDIPSDGTNPIKTTDNLQAAIDWAVTEGFGKIHLPAGHYLVGKYGNDVYQAGIELKSNMAFLLDKDAIIEMAPNDKWNYSIISVSGKENVVISGGTMIGDRYAHTFTPSKSGSTRHDEGHIITIKAESEYVTVENVVIGKGTGDGILLVGIPVKNINIRRNDIFDNRRQGISLVGTENVVIEENEIHHTNGANPQFGIDIEGTNYDSKDIIIRSNYFHHNKGGNIVNFDSKNLLIEDNILEQGEGCKWTDGNVSVWVSGGLVIRHNEFTSLYDEDNIKTIWCGVLMYPRSNRSTTSAQANIHDNTFTNCGFYMNDGRNLNIHDNILKNGFFGFYGTKNLTLKDNEVTREWGECRLYHFKGVAGSATGNLNNGDPINIPLSSDPFDGDTCSMQ